MAKGLDFVKKVCLFTALPVFLALFLNTFISISLPKFPLKDIMASGVAAYVLFLLVLDQKKPLQVDFQKKYLLLCALLLLVFLILAAWNGWQTPLILEPNLLAVVFVTLSVFMLAAGFFVFMAPSYFIKRVLENRGEVVFALILITCLFINFFVNEAYWKFLSRPTAHVARWLLEFFGLELLKSPNPMVIKNSIVSIRVGQLCSGFDGIFLFIFVYTAFLMFDWKKYSLPKILMTYAAGITLMMTLNLVRVTSLFAGFFWLATHWEKKQATQMIVWLFHSNIGWLLYMVGIGLFFAVMLWLEHRTKPAQNR